MAPPSVINLVRTRRVFYPVRPAIGISPAVFDNAIPTPAGAGEESQVHVIDTVLGWQSLRHASMSTPSKEDLRPLPSLGVTRFCRTSMPFRRQPEEAMNPRSTSSGQSRAGNRDGMRPCDALQRRSETPHFTRGDILLQHFIVIQTPTGGGEESQVYVIRKVLDLQSRRHAPM